MYHPIDEVRSSALTFTDMKATIRQLVLLILTWQARIVLVKYKPRVIGITGNVGKTSTKDAIAAVMASAFQVRANKKSLNSEFGVPLTILDRPSGWGSAASWLLTISKGMALIIFPYKYPKWLIVEIGVEYPGDMENMVRWLRFDIVVLTAMGNPPVHTEFFSSPEELYKEKAKIIVGLKKEGLVVANFDDKVIMGMVHCSNCGVITYGTHKGVGVHAENYQILYRTDEHASRVPDGMTFKVDYLGKSLPVHMPGAFGRHNIYVALAAVAVGMSQKINQVEILNALREAKRPPGRLALLRGIRGSIIVDDTYNSSPMAAKHAIESLEEIDKRNKIILVLGDMAELGEYTESAHRKLGEQAAGVADYILTVGARSIFIDEGALGVGYNRDSIYHFETSDQAKKPLENLIETGDIVLIKGSESIRMERIVKEVMAEPERAQDLLVRQEPAWLAR